MCKPCLLGFFLLLPVGFAYPGRTESLDLVEPLIQSDCKQNPATALPAKDQNCVWIKVRETISIETLSGSLRLAVGRIARLNDAKEDHVFSPGDWLVLPISYFRLVGRVSAIDGTQVRYSSPLPPPQKTEESAVVRFGDTVFKIAQRYGLTLSELLRLNPHMDTARLVVGSPIRLAELDPQIPRMVAGNIGEYTSNTGVSSIGLVGPFKRTPAAFTRFLNSKPRSWEDPSLRTYFYDLYNCHSFPADIENTMPPSFKCDGGYVSLTDNLGSRRCQLDYASWSWNEGQSFRASRCR